MRCTSFWRGCGSSRRWTSCWRCRGTSTPFPSPPSPTGLAHVFGAPTTAAPVFDRAREDFWSSRLAGDSPEPEWMEWQAWLEYKHEEVERTVPFRLARGRHRADAAAGAPRHRPAERPASWAKLAHADPIIDAFTDRPFGGNPAAVCLLDGRRVARRGLDAAGRRGDEPLGDGVRASAASDGGDADWALRWFTPEVEVDLCGHATLATAHALHRDRGAPGTVRFLTRSGVLIAHTADDGTITLDFPAAPPTEVAPPDGLAAGPRRHRRPLLAPAHSATCWSSFANEAAVRALPRTSPP